MTMTGMQDLVTAARSVLDANWTGASTVPSRTLYPHQWSGQGLRQHKVANFWASSGWVSIGCGCMRVMGRSSHGNQTTRPFGRVVCGVAAWRRRSPRLD